MSQKQVKGKLQLMKTNDIQADATGIMIFLYSKAKFASKLAKIDRVRYSTGEDLHPTRTFFRHSCVHKDSDDTVIWEEMVTSVPQKNY
jgi:hypothetical protein